MRLGILRLWLSNQDDGAKRRVFADQPLWPVLAKRTATKLGSQEVNVSRQGKVHSLWVVG